MVSMAVRTAAFGLSLVCLCGLPGATTLGIGGIVLAASEGAPASRPASPVRLAFVDAQKALKEYRKSAGVEAKLKAVQQEAVAAQMQGDHETMRKLVERLAGEREAAIRDLLVDVKLAAARVAEREHYDVVSVNNIYIREGIEVPDVTAEVIADLNATWSETMPATATAPAAD